MCLFVLYQSDDKQRLFSEQHEMMVFIAEKEGVPCAGRNEFLNKIRVNRRIYRVTFIISRSNSVGK
jgi:hypothetical protein